MNYTYNTVSERYKAALELIKTQQPWLLVGLNILTILIAYSPVVTPSILLMPVLAIAMIPIFLSLSAGLSAVFLKAVRGEKYELADVFAAFRDVETLKRVAGGMCWMYLLVYLWSVIPLMVIYFGSGIMMTVISVIIDNDSIIVLWLLWAVFISVIAVFAIVLAVIKSIEYIFTPYILITRPDIRATDAVKESSRLTKGIRGRIFVAILLPSLVFSIYFGIMAALAETVPFFGALIGLFAMAVYVIYLFGYPVLSGLVMAGFYDAALKAPPQPDMWQYQYWQQNMQPMPPQPATAPETPVPAPEPIHESAPEPDNNSTEEIQ